MWDAYRENSTYSKSYEEYNTWRRNYEVRGLRMIVECKNSIKLSWAQEQNAPTWLSEFSIRTILAISVSYSTSFSLCLSLFLPHPFFLSQFLNLLELIVCFLYYIHLFDFLAPLFESNIVLWIYFLFYFVLSRSNLSTFALYNVECTVWSVTWSICTLYSRILCTTPLSRYSNEYWLIARTHEQYSVYELNWSASK